MIVECADIDQARLIQDRLSADGITFPSLRDVVDNVERIRPEFFDFFSFHGRLVYVKTRFCRSKRYFRLICRNFNPAALFGITVLHYSPHQEEYLCFEMSDFDFIMAKFRSFCRGLLENG